VAAERLRGVVMFREHREHRVERGADLLQKCGVKLENDRRPHLLHDPSHPAKDERFRTFNVDLDETDLLDGKPGAQFVEGGARHLDRIAAGGGGGKQGRHARVRLGVEMQCHRDS